MIVLFVVADSLKAGAPGFGGGPPTPFLDGLAKEGAVFEDVFAAGAWTVPSIMSMLTGTLGHKIGLGRWRHPFPAERPTLFTAFRAAGFDVTCFHPYPEWGFLTIPGKQTVGDSQNPDEVTDYLRNGRGRDRFVMIHHWWTHLPYINKRLSRKSWYGVCDYSLESLNRYPERIGKKLEENYLKTVAYFSEEVLAGYMDAAAAGGEKVILIVTGDHGETWGASLPEGRRVEHVYDLHGRWIADETIRIPLLIHGASDARPGARIPGFASGADIGPTIAELAGVPWPGPVPDDAGPGIVRREGQSLDIIGRSLVPFIKSERATHRSEVHTVSSHNTHVPHTYPEDGREMWRTMAMRRPEAWYVWDGVTEEGVVKPTGEAPAADEKTVSEILLKLEALRQEAVDSAPMVEDQHLDDLRENRVEGVGRRLRSLGYLD